MESIVVIALQVVSVLAEILINTAFCVFLYPTGEGYKRLARHRLYPQWVAILMAFAFGMVLGRVSVLVVDRLLIDLFALRVANLVLTPTIIGYLVYRWAQKRAVEAPLQYALVAICFSIAFSGYRFVYAL